MENIYRKHIINLYSNAKKIIKGWSEGDWNKPNSWLILGTTLAEIIENADDIKGEEKKDIVIETITQIVSDKDVIKDLNNDIRDKIITVINLTLPTTIDLIIKASKGELKINKKIKKICCCIK